MSLWPERREVQVDGREVQLTIAERPSYVISGTTYRALVLARNSGNVPADYRLLISSSLGSPLDAPREVRTREALYATAWFDTITDEVFG